MRRFWWFGVGFLLVCMSFSRLSAQNILDLRVSFRCSGLGVKSAIDSLSRQIKVPINYRADLLSDSIKVSVNYTSQPLVLVLNELCKGLQVSFEGLGRSVVIKKQRKISHGAIYFINGKIRSAKTGESLIGANLYVIQTGTGCISNHYGFFALSLAGGTYDIVVNSLGFKKKTIHLLVERNLSLDIALEEDEIELAEVQVSDSDDTEVEEGVYVKEHRTGAISIDYNTMKKIPNLLGEFDPVRATTLFPGVSKGNETSAGLFVRGGNADQNLILLDEAPIYNASHVLGLFSIFNPDALKDMELYKTNIPANYGGRISSVLDVRLREGNREKWSLSGGLGTLTARLAYEQPFLQGKGTIMAAARRSMIDYFRFNVPLISFNESSIAFGDFSLKSSYHFSQRNKILFSFYTGSDFVGFQDLYSTAWGNLLGTLRWNHLYSPRLFSNLTLYTSNFLSANANRQYPKRGFEQQSSFSDFGIKKDFSFFYANELTLDFGFEAIYHNYFFGKVKPIDGSFILPRRTIPQNAVETNVYFSAEHDFSPSLSLIYGLRFSRFDNIGRYQIYQYADSINKPGSHIEEGIIDTILHENLKSFHFYQGIEPRFSLRYMLSDVSSLKIAYSRTRQYIHQLSTTNTPSPLDMWAPSSPHILPQIADQISAGYFWSWKNGLWEASAEIYAKQMRNILDFRPSANLLLNDHIETEVTPGLGRAYGLELLVRKPKGKLTGWVSYTLARAERKTNGINSNSWYPAAFDRLHQANWVFSYQIHPRISLSANWVYASGQAYTFPVAQYEKDGFIVPYYTLRNTYRLPDNHRLDISATFFRRASKKIKNNSTFNLSVYNVYARQNALGYIFRQSKTDPRRSEAVKLYIFTIVPSFSYNFKF